MRLLSYSAGVALVASTLGGCIPGAAPRTGDITQHGLALDASLPVVNYEPQSVVLHNGNRIDGKIAIFPSPQSSIRGKLGERFEFGGVISMGRYLAEARFGPIQESNGAPLSIALSAAAGARVLPPSPWARVGVDMSRRFGSFALMLDSYLSVGTEFHWMNLPEDKVPPGDLPKEGPLPASASLVRRELRLHIPFGIAVRVSEGESSDVDLLFGGNAWWVLTHGDPYDSTYPDYEATRGVEFSVGLGFR
ncbi:MAG: hypothetical protein H6718_13715 [Polyangiaceae bacterium]|nr:hypothetical protein [Polyangiaceae bacterium]MCB9605961.1 hypothetical protein [Polyangiaceae bacterium]